MKLSSHMLCAACRHLTMLSFVKNPKRTGIDMCFEYQMIYKRNEIKNIKTKLHNHKILQRIYTPTCMYACTHLNINT